MCRIMLTINQIIRLFLTGTAIVAMLLSVCCCWPTDFKVSSSRQPSVQTCCQNAAPLSPISLTLRACWPFYALAAALDIAQIQSLKGISDRERRRRTHGNGEINPFPENELAAFQ